MSYLIQETALHIHLLKQKSKLLSLMQEFCKKVALHRDAVIETGKPKKQEQLARMADGIYPIQCLFFTPTHEYLSTWVLQGTEKSVPFLISAAAEFATYIDLFKFSFDSVKQNQQLFQHLKENFNYKSNDILSLLLDDLDYLKSQYSLSNIDKKACVDEFKLQKEKHTQNIKKHFKENKKVDLKLIEKF